MPRATLAPFIPPDGRAALPLAAGVAKLPLVAADAVNFNRTPMSGHELIVANNPTGGALTLTVHSVADVDKRVGDIAAYSIPAGETHVLGPFPLEGWAQAADANALWFDASAAGLMLAVLKAS